MQDSTCCLVSSISDEAEHAASHSFGSEWSLYLMLIISNFTLSQPLDIFLQTSCTVLLSQYHAGPVTSVKFTLRCTASRKVLNPYNPLSATPYLPSNISSASLRTISIFVVMCIAGAVSASTRNLRTSYASHKGSDEAEAKPFRPASQPTEPSLEVYFGNTSTMMCRLNAMPHPC
jgi:hypothetical protein